MIRTRLARLGIAATAGVAAVLGITSPAYAANTNCELVYRDMLRGEMIHYDDGDHFRVYDWYADGYAVYGQLESRFLGGSWTYVDSAYTNTGAGTYKTFDEDVLSAYHYRMRVCIQKGGPDAEPVACAWQEFDE